MSIKIIPERVKGDWTPFPLTVTCNETVFHFSLEKTIEENWYPTIQQIGKKRGRCAFAFFSSQEGFIFDRLHDMLNAYIPDLATKVDPLLREFVKNAEKQNIITLAQKTGLLPQNSEHLSLHMMGKILQEKVLVEETNTPILYSDPSLLVEVIMQSENNNLIIEIKNKGHLSKEQQEIIRKKIELGRKIAQFDLRQEFEMKAYPECKAIIEEFLYYEYQPEELPILWEKAIEETFDDYWLMSPYFLLMGSGVHSSFFPYYATVHGLLRAAQKELHNISENAYSAGMGYIQSAFIIESNRSLYGTDGQIFTPLQDGEKVKAFFQIGFPSIEVDFPIR